MWHTASPARSSSPSMLCIPGHRAHPVRRGAARLKVGGQWPPLQGRQGERARSSSAHSGCGRRNEGRLRSGWARPTSPAAHSPASTRTHAHARRDPVTWLKKRKFAHAPRARRRRGGTRSPTSDARRPRTLPRQPPSARARESSPVAAWQPATARPRAARPRGALFGARPRVAARVRSWAAAAAARGGCGPFKVTPPSR